MICFLSDDGWSFVGVVGEGIWECSTVFHYSNFKRKSIDSIKFKKMRRSSIILLLFLAVFFLLRPTHSTIANCYIYTSSNTSCSLCNAGYAVTNSGSTCTANDCSGMSQCSLCDTTTTCLNCNFGYSLSSDRSTCTKISCTDTNCSLCASTSANQCYSCNVASYVTTAHIC